MFIRKAASTLNFANCGTITVRRGRAYGRGGAAGEFNGASLRWNGVAFIKATNCDYADIEGIQAWDHAGGCIVLLGVGHRRCHWNIIEGIGPDYISPFDNGSDFGIMCQPSVNNETQLFEFEDRFVNVRTFNHAFGVQTVATKSLFIRGCDIGPHQGQHGDYAIVCDGLNVQGNNFAACRQFCFKQQYENYAGRFGPAWQASTAYAVGNTVRAFGRLYRCKTAHTSGSSFSSTNWDIHPLMFRKPGVIGPNRRLLRRQKAHQLRPQRDERREPHPEPSDFRSEWSNDYSPHAGQSFRELQPQ